MLSPSADLVDLLELLHDESPAAYAELLRRRPDLVDVELSCANTEREVPAIDLALEILENATALPLTVDLPPGSDATTLLSADRLPDAVRAALQRTAIQVGTDLRAAPEPEDRQQPGIVAWTVTDGPRRCTPLQTSASLLVTPASLVRGPYPLSTQGLDVATAVADLDRAVPPAGTLDTQLRAATGTDPIMQQLLESAGVEVVEPGRRWRVGYTVGFVNATVAALDAGGAGSHGGGAAAVGSRAHRRGPRRRPVRDDRNGHRRRMCGRAFRAATAAWSPWRSGSARCQQAADGPARTRPARTDTAGAADGA